MTPLAIKRTMTGLISGDNCNNRNKIVTEQ